MHDFYLQGLAQPLLGTFSINLRPFLEVTRGRVEKKLKEEAGPLEKASGQVVEEDLEDEEAEEAALLGDKKKLESKEIEIKVDKGEAKDKLKISPKGSCLLPPEIVVIKPKYEGNPTKGYEVEKNRPDLE